MSVQQLPSRETPASRFVDDFRFLSRKLDRYSTGLTAEELGWTPSGIKNSMSWIICHLATTLWICHSLVSGKPCRYDPLAAGIPMQSTKGIKYGTDRRVPQVSIGSPTGSVREAFEALREALESGTEDLDETSVYVDRKWRTRWWFLTHELVDFAYHTGQASYLRKLIAEKRTRLGKKRSASPAQQ